MLHGRLAMYHLVVAFGLLIMGSGIIYRLVVQ